MSKSVKVFGLGFQKSGTTSLGHILEELGYKTAGYFQFRHLADNWDLSWDELRTIALSAAEDWDAAKDTPWPLLYRDLDIRFPGSKFIHVTRSPESWIKSVVMDFGGYPNALHKLIYGSAFPVGNEQAWLDRYMRHNQDVADYFRNRPEDYLHIRLEEGISFDVICPFLNESLIKRGNPKANTRFQKKLKMAWWRLIRKA